MDVDVEKMVQRFLSWRLPDDFQPDGGVSFDRSHDAAPVGTNLLNHFQATEMVRHLLGLDERQTVEFGEALRHMTSGGRARRAAWRPGQTVRIRPSGTRDDMPYIELSTEAYLRMRPTCEPWTPSHSDLLRADWELLT